MSRIRDRWLYSRTARPLALGAAWSFLTQSASKLSVLVMMAVGARALGASGLGLFASIQAVVLLSVSLADLGVSALMVREVAAHQESAGSLLRAALWLRLYLLGLPIVLAGALMLPLGAFPALGSLGVVAILVALCANSGVLLLSSVATGRLEFKGVATAVALGRLVSVGVCVIALAVPKSFAIGVMCTAFAVGEVISLLGLTRVLRRMSWTADSAAAVVSRFRLLQRGVPYLANGLLNTAYNRFDIPLVALLAGPASAGFYAPASRAIDALFLFPSVATAALTPLMANRLSRADGTAGAKRAFSLSMTASVAVSIPASLAVVLLARWGLPLVLGAGYEQSVVPVQIAAAALPFVAIGYPVACRLQAEGRAMDTTKMFVAGAAVALIGILLLASRYGAVGASVASTVREPVIMIVGLALLRRGTRANSSSIMEPAPGVGDERDCAVPKQGAPTYVTDSEFGPLH